MANLQIANSNPEIDFQPDFSDFNKVVLGWNMFYSYDFKKEPYFSIEFAGLPMYKGKPIEKEQLITIPLQGFPDIEMYVRSIHYSMSNGKAITTILLKTAKIFLDQVKLISVPNNNTINVFNAIIKAIGKDKEINIIVDNSLKWATGTGAKDITITANETILQWLIKQLGKNPIFDWWFDIFNDLVAKPLFKPSDTPYKIDYNDIAPELLSLDIILMDKYGKQENVISSNTANPAQSTKPRDGVAVNPTANTSKAHHYSGRSTKNSDNTINGSMASVVIPTNSVGIVLKGLHFYPEHSKISLINFNFDFDNSNKYGYFLESVDLSYNGSGTATTKLNISSATYTLPEQKNDDDDKKKKHGKRNTQAENPTTNQYKTNKGDVLPGP